MGKTADNEQHKLMATFYNNLAVTAAASGVSLRVKDQPPKQLHAAQVLGAIVSAYRPGLGRGTVASLFLHRSHQSITSVPPTRNPNWSPKIVTVDSSALRRMCRNSTMRSNSPFARAVRTKSEREVRIT